MGEIRIQKYLSQSGIASRRRSEIYISSGRVKINENTAKIGDKVDPQTDKVYFDSKPVILNQSPYTYIMLNKPSQIVSTLSDEHDRKTIRDLIDDLEIRVYPVGRLDYDTEGLIIMTNDGDFTFKMTHPSKNIIKTYEAEVSGTDFENKISTLSMPMMIDGRKTAPAQVEMISSQEGKAKLRFKIHEGRNRQIRRLCENAGLYVIKLKRTAIGPILLGNLPCGKWRYLTDPEINTLKKAAEGDGR